MAKGIEKFYRRSAFDLLMFGHISALVNSLPSISIEKAALNFMHFYNISEQEITLQGVLTSFYRMRKEYFESEKTKDDAEV